MSNARKTDNKALYLINQALNDDSFENVSNTTTAKEACMGEASYFQLMGSLQAYEEKYKKKKWFMEQLQLNLKEKEESLNNGIRERGREHDEG